MPDTNRLQLLTNGPADAPVTVVLAHGAGAGMDTEFMNVFAEGLAETGLRMVRFEFPYMIERRRTGKRRPPNREPVLLDAWRNAIDSLDAETLVIGGKSMGGRMASLIADESKAAALVCLGYPFHPTGKPDRLRTEHLETIKTPTLILQGERDALGSRTEVAGYRLSANVKVRWLPDGDHSFKPRKKSGRTQGQNWEEAIAAIGDFVRDEQNDGSL